MNLIQRVRFTALPALAFLLASPCVVLAQAQGGDAHIDTQIQAEVQHALSNKRFSGIQAQVENGTVTLTGTVDRFSTKQDAENKVRKLKDSLALNDNIVVAAPEGITDQALFDKLSKGLTYDRVGYGTTMFNDINLGVHDGIVTVSGTVYGPTDKDSAMSLIANTPGVRGVVDNLKVAPLSPMDDRIRMAEARAIYGFGPLNRYAIDPAKTIRITVVNGRVTLNGVVDSEADKNMAGIRANTVPGVFAVVNNLQIQGEVAEQRH